MPTLPDFFSTLYSTLDHPERYAYELRYLKASARPLTAFLDFKTLIDFQQSKHALSAKAKNDAGYNLYFGINPRRNKRGGDKEQIAACVALYVDIDVKDFLTPDERKIADISIILERKPEILTAIKAQVQAAELKPTAVIDSGRGFQLYWLLDPPVMLPATESNAWTEMVDLVERKNAALATLFHGDHIGNVDRIFRFPAFTNRKPVRKGAAELTTLPVQMLFLDPERRYALDRFPLPDQSQGELSPTREGACSPIVSPVATPPELSEADRAVLQKARAAKNGAKFQRLWSGDWNGYKSQSEAEYALCYMLAYWTNNDRWQIDRLFRQSQLYRPKWDTPFNGTTNGLYTIDKILARAGSPSPAPAEPYVKVEFWFEKVINEGRDNERVELNIDYKQFLEFLRSNGFGLLIYDKQVQIVRCKDNVVSQTIEKGNMNLTIKQFVLDYLEHEKKDDVTELMLRRHSTFFSTAFLTSLKPLHLTFYRDTATRCALFFENGYVQIEKNVNGITTVFQPYSALKESIWETHINDRVYRGQYHDHPLTPAHEEKISIFADFIKKAALESVGNADTYEEIADNTDAFGYGLAYLLHDYKDYANARGIICVDNDASFEANGRRGKSLFCEALKRLRRVNVEDGRTLKMDNNQFVFQTVDLDTQILLIDDAKPKFDYTQLFTVITGIMALERKRDQRVILSFEESPKLVITTNHAVLGNGDSNAARWYLLPFTKYFNAGHTPMDEYKQRLFVDWDDQEWNRFFDYAISCLEAYFEDETPPVANLSTYNESKLKSALPAELLDYLDEYLGELPYEVQKDIFIKDFKNLYPVYEKATQNWFTSKLSIYCKQKGISINPGYEDNRQWKTPPDGGKRKEYLNFVREAQG